MSSAEVSLRFASEPSTRATSRPNHCAMPASSVKVALASFAAARWAARIASKRKPCGVCARQSSIARQRSGHAAVLRRRQSVCHRHAGEGGVMLIEACDDAGDQRRLDEGPRRVMDQHAVGRVGGKRLEPRADGVLPLRATSDRRPQPRRKALRSGLVEPDILWMDRHDYVVHAWMPGKGCDRPGQHRHAADRKILLWDQRLRPRRSDPASGGNDQGANAHG